MKTMAKIDWVLLEEEYIYGYINDEGQKIFPSITDLHKRHNVPRGSIGNRATKGNWVQKKADKTDKIRRKIHEEKTEYAAQSIVQTDQKFEETGLLIRRVANKKLEQLEDDLKNNVYVRSIDIMNTSNAVRIGQDIVKTAQGELTNKIGVEQSGKVTTEVNLFDRVDKLREFVEKGNKDANK